MAPGSACPAPTSSDSHMRKITVGMVLFPGFQLLDIAGPKDAFAEGRILSEGACGHEILPLSTTRGSVLSSIVLPVGPERPIVHPCRPVDTLSIPVAV